MGLSHITVIAAISLSGLLPSSCSKSPAPQQSAPMAKAGGTAGTSRIKNLGVLQLTNHYETEVNLGHGKSCIITPQLLDRHNLQLTMSFESKNAQGRAVGLNVIRIVAEPGRPFDMTVGETDLTFTPKLTE